MPVFLILILSVIVVGVVSTAFGRWLQRKGRETEHRGDPPPR